jgi:YfiH family protein
LVEARRRAVVALPWTWLRQVHGAGVVRVTRPGEHAGAVADAAVTDVPGAALSVGVADCAPVILEADGAVGVVHAGWRGLAAGVVPAAVAALRELTDGPVRATLGPCIRPGCYEFGPDDLDAVASVLGDEVRAETDIGRPALDVPAAVRASLRSVGVEAVTDTGVCTRCSPDHWSHRGGDRHRQVAAAWLP